MGTAANILIVDDEPSMSQYLRSVLEMDSHHVDTVSNGYDAVRRVERAPAPDLVLLDLLMPGMDGIETLKRLRKARPGIRVVMLSCVGDTRKVAEAVRHGALDYLTKPLRKHDLDTVLEKVLEGAGADEDGPLVEEFGEGHFMVAANSEMRELRRQAALVAKVDVPVLLLGESGTGKEVLARFIHAKSPASQKPFLKVNCAALPGDLLESELFGYEPGAFTGATQAKPGKFELANKGTILLDEIGELPATLQAKLLHVLQDKQFSRLGGRTVIKVEVRILAATNIDVKQAIASKALREDLYYRLNGITLKVPPLRERKDSIPILLRHFMARASAACGAEALPISGELIEACQSYSWPGNIRELENVVKRYLVLGDESLIVSDLQNRDRQLPAVTEAPAAAGDLKRMVRDLKGEAEMRAISVALEQTDWNRKEAALMLNISYKALLYKIRQFGLTRPRRGQAAGASGI